MKNIIIPILILLLNIKDISANSEKILVDRTLVEVEKEAITLSDLETHSRIQIVISEGPESLFKMNDSSFINSMIALLINRELVSLELKKERRFKPNLYIKEAENLYIKIRSKFNDALSFQKFLNDIYQNEAELKRTLAIYIMIDDYLNKLAEKKVKVEDDEYNKFISQLGIIPPSDEETINRYKNELKTEKKKNFVATYLETLKGHYRIRYLYISK